MENVKKYTANGGRYSGGIPPPFAALYLYCF